MRLRRLITLLALPLALAACDDSTAPAPPTSPPPPPSPASIAGSWTRVHDPATANMIDHLGFGVEGFYARDIMVYKTAAHGSLVSTYREEGTYRLNGERLELRITHTTEWDEVTGGAPVVTTRAGTWADAGTVRISGNTMDRTYVTYPPDAPSETTIRYVKALLD